MENNPNPLSVDDDDNECGDDLEEDSDESEIDDDDDLTVNEQLRMSTQKILMDCDQTSVNLSDMDEEDGAKLDEMLGEAFKQFAPNSKTRKKESNTNKVQQIEFKVKIFDLLDIYVKSKHTVLDVIIAIQLTVLKLYEFCCKNGNKLDEPLRNRCQSVLKLLEKKIRGQFDVKVIRRFVKKLMNEYSTITSVAGATVWADSIVFWVKMVLRSNNEKQISKMENLVSTNVAQLNKLV